MGRAEWGLCEDHKIELTDVLRAVWTEDWQRCHDERLASAEVVLAGSRPPAHIGDQVYYLRRDSDRAIKIGHSINLATRIAQVRKKVASDVELLAVQSGGESTEKALHETFRHLRIRRTEWFRPASELLRHVAAVRQTSLASEEVVA